MNKITFTIKLPFLRITVHLRKNDYWKTAITEFWQQHINLQVKMKHFSKCAIPLPAKSYSYHRFQIRIIYICSYLLHMKLWWIFEKEINYVDISTKKVIAIDIEWRAVWVGSIIFSSQAGGEINWQWNRTSIIRRTGQTFFMNAANWLVTSGRVSWYNLYPSSRGLKRQVY